MSEKIRDGVGPAYLLLCLCLGGSSQGIWANAFLQLGAIAIIAWAAMERGGEAVPPRARQLTIIAALALLLIALQLVPLPPAIWTALPGRSIVVEGFATLGLEPGWMPLSLAPYDGLATVAALLPPIAMTVAVIKLGRRSPWLALAVAGATAAAVMLGALQVAGTASADSPWYFYERSNFGVATGFFANSNHMATLLLVAIPFVVALGMTAARWADDARKRAAAMAVVAGLLLLILVGLVLNGSLAGYGLALPVAIASLLLIVRPRGTAIRSAALALGLVGLVSFLLLLASPLNERFVGEEAATSLSTRQTLAAHSLEALETFGLVGSGLGSYAELYPLFESPATVNTTFVNHAHDDYLELAVELGLPGILLMLSFLIWWGATAWQVGRSQAYDQYAQAGVVASAAILIHSAVDFPLRTAAVAALFAASIALMVVSKRSTAGKSDLRPTRHLVIH